MRDITYVDKGFTFKRINKKQARAAYRSGLKVAFCPVNLRPGEPYHPEIIQDAKANGGTPWSDILNAFEWYNCNNNEVGRYAAFYIPVRSVDMFTGEAITPDTRNIITAYDYRFLEV